MSTFLYTEQNNKAIKTLFTYAVGTLKVEIFTI